MRSQQDDRSRPPQLVKGRQGFCLVCRVSEGEGWADDEKIRFPLQGGIDGGANFAGTAGAEALSGDCAVCRSIDATPVRLAQTAGEFEKDRLPRPVRPRQPNDSPVHEGQAGLQTQVALLIPYIVELERHGWRGFHILPQGWNGALIRAAACARIWLSFELEDFGGSNRKLLGLDLGAESGRAILGTLENDRLRLQELHRFSNTAFVCSTVCIGIRCGFSMK